MPLMKAVPRRGDDTRGSILRAALDLFGDRGYECTTVRNIAERCGLTDAALYYYVPTQQEILETLISDQWRLPPGMIGDQVAATRNLPPRERMLALLDAALDELAATGAALRFMRRCVVAGSLEARSHRRRQWRAWEQFASGFFDDALTSGQRRLLVDSLFTFIQGLSFSAWMEHGARASVVLRSQRFRDRVHDLVLIAVPVAAFFNAERPSA
ncbi:MAG: TetR/AcrR family transcriptional regulator [Dehalococcoidia bacterium]|nr:TetR/AcrR family transcriptional regulator [Dehalococcoidia bacterium]